MSQPDYREILTNLYSRFAPNMLDRVDSILEKYKGEEKELIRTLGEKYGVSGEDLFRISKPPSWVKALCDKHGFDSEQTKKIDKCFIDNEIDQDVSYSLTEPHCIGLFNTPLKLRMQIWEMVKKETGRSSEVEKLREEIVKLKNENDQLKAELQSKQ
jgi:hypothetical protein